MCISIIPRVSAPVNTYSEDDAGDIQEWVSVWTGLHGCTLTGPQPFLVRINSKRTTGDLMHVGKKEPSKIRILSSRAKLGEMNPGMPEHYWFLSPDHSFLYIQWQLQWQQENKSTPFHWPHVPTPHSRICWFHHTVGLISRFEAIIFRGSIPLFLFPILLKHPLKSDVLSHVMWFTPVIPALQEARARGTQVWA